jgi:hypothetical protein
VTTDDAEVLLRQAAEQAGILERQAASVARWLLA